MINYVYRTAVLSIPAGCDWPRSGRLGSDGHFEFREAFRRQSPSSLTRSTASTMFAPHATPTKPATPGTYPGGIGIDPSASPHDQTSLRVRVATGPKRSLSTSIRRHSRPPSDISVTRAAVSARGRAEQLGHLGNQEHPDRGALPVAVPVRILQCVQSRFIQFVR